MKLLYYNFLAILGGFCLNCDLDGDLGGCLNCDLGGFGGWAVICVAARLGAVLGW